MDAPVEFSKKNQRNIDILLTYPAECLQTKEILSIAYIRSGFDQSRIVFFDL